MKARKAAKVARLLLSYWRRIQIYHFYISSWDLFLLPPHVRARSSCISSSSPLLLLLCTHICHPTSPPGMRKEGLMRRTRHSSFHLPRPNISRHISDTKGSAWVPPLSLSPSFFLPLSFPPSPSPPLPPPSPFNIEAGDEKWCAFVYLPPMQMRPQQD